MTVRVDDPPPGVELQVDFGRLGLIADGEKRRVCWALIFTACFSRHQFVWPTFSQTTEDVIAVEQRSTTALRSIAEWSAAADERRRGT